MANPRRLSSIVIEQMLELARNDPNQTINGLAQRFNISNASVSKYMRKNGVHLRRKGYEARYAIDETFFSVIDTPTKAQVLGLIYADGSMSAFNNLISIRLAQEDEAYLVAINRVMGHTKPIYYVHRAFMISPNNGKTYKTQTTCILDITRMQMYQDLQRLGICVNKTRVDLHLPPISDHLIRWFILGLFEGDGWLTSCLRPDQTIQSIGFGIALSESMGKEISAYFDKHLGIGPGGLKQIGAIWKLTYASQPVIARIMTWLYEIDTGLRMDRKYQTWLRFKEYFHSAVNNTSSHLGRRRQLPSLSSPSLE